MAASTTPAVSAVVPSPSLDWDPDESLIQFAPGVKLDRWVWKDTYSGKIDDMVAAGIVRADRIPGAPGMAKTMFGIFPSGELAPARTYCHGIPGTKSVRRTGKRLTVSVTLSKDDELARETALQASREAKKQKEQDRILIMSNEERDAEIADHSMRMGPESSLKSMPKTVMDFRRKLVDDVRFHVRYLADKCARAQADHAFVLDAGAVEVIKISVDAVVEAVMAAEVTFDEARQTAIVHKLHGYMVAKGVGAPEQVAKITKLNPSLLSESAS